MNLTEIKALVNQPRISSVIKDEVITKATNYIKEELDVEVVVDRKSIAIDVYNEKGVRIDRVLIKLI